MPRWGRPPAGRRGKNNKEWERQQREWEEQNRFEELESDSDDDGQGVHLASDELHFTGADLGQHLRNRRSYDYSDNSEYDDGLGTQTSGGPMQIALREKEEVLVQRAMDRIRRAQALGKTNVKLTEPERDALERKMAKDREKGRKAILPNKKSDPRRSSSKTNLVAQSGKKKASRSSLAREAESPNPPGFVVAGPDGRPIYAPIGYPAEASNSRPSSRSSSTQSLQHSPQPSSSSYRNAPPARRYVSGPDSTAPRPTSASARPLPDDPNWRPRSSSSAASTQYNYQVDAYGHPYFPAQPGPAGYPQPTNPYPSLRGAPALPPSGYGSSSDPVLARGSRRSGVPPQHQIQQREEYYSETSSEESSDGGSGVEVDVVPYASGSGYEIVAAPAPAAAAPPSRQVAQKRVQAATRKKGRR